MISIAVNIAIASAVKIEQLVGNLCNILLLGNIIENPTPASVLDPSV